MCIRDRPKGKIVPGLTLKPIAKKLSGYLNQNVTFLDRSTVHVASDFMGSYIGNNCIIGRYSLVHACTLGDKVIIGDQAIVMDGSNVGDNSIITANSLIPPGKTFAKNSLISGALKSLL